MATGSKAKGNYRPMAMLMYASAQRAGSVKRVLPKDQGQKAVTKESMIAPPVLVTEATVTDKLIQLHRYIQCHPITSIYIQILYTYMPCNWQWPIPHIRFDGCFWLSLVESAVHYLEILSMWMCNPNLKKEHIPHMPHFQKLQGW